MSKTVREIEVKFYLCFLDALMDNNPSVEKIDIEDEVMPEQISSKVFSGTFRLKSMHRKDTTIEKVYIKRS